MSTQERPFELAIISGKGGAGKTTVCAAFATLAENAVLADCDVDAPDLHLILEPDIKETEAFFGLQLAQIDPEACTNCGICRQHCRFEAITEQNTIVKESCEGCGVCGLVCPENAITLVDRQAGDLFISETRAGPFVHASLFPGEESSGKLVERVRSAARLRAHKLKVKVLLLDGPPGIGCPVIATITGVDMLLIVTEPSLSGISDMKRVVEMAEHFKVPATVLINKFDINTENTEAIEKFCQEQKIPVIGRLPYDTTATRAMLQGLSVPEYVEKQKPVGAGLDRLLRLAWVRVLEDLRNARG
jgi:MinD superfamily P-loop ATPase